MAKIGTEIGSDEGGVLFLSPPPPKSSVPGIHKTEPLNKVLLISHQVGFLLISCRQGDDVRHVRFPRGLLRSGDICTSHRAWRLQIHLLKEPCEEARTINKKKKKIFPAINQPRGAAAAAAAPTSWFHSCRPRGGAWGNAAGGGGGGDER